MEALLNREYNEKCLLISGGIVGAYYILPPDKLWVGAELAVFSYEGIVWYDSSFGCQDRLTASDSPWPTPTRPIKTQNTYLGLIDAKLIPSPFP